jgi:cytidylate kinase
MAIISICRGTKSGGEALARCLAEQFEYPILGREVLQEAAAQLGVPADDLVEKMEDRPRFFDRSATLRKTYIAAVQATLAEAAAGGDLVYHGLAGGFLLKDVPGVICVRLIAPMEMRIRTLQNSHGMDEASAEAYIREVDEARARWVKGMYGVDILDPTNYDMVLNLGTFSIPEACSVITAAVGRPEFMLTEKRLGELDDFRVSSQVRLALMDDMGTQTLDLTARAKRGVVEIHGQAPILNTGEVGNRITEIARSVRGVKEVVLKIEWFDPYP